jgi:ABC-type bacteriocin/lantibiotic exporter with double-glycine peptidase domain
MLLNMAPAERGAWIDVPFVEQGPNGCGAASALMVYRYWSEKFPALAQQPEGLEEVERLLQPDPHRGISGSALESFFRGTGFQAFVFKGAWKDLDQHIRKGRPLIVSIDGQDSAIPLHFVVVCGVDPENDLVFLNDPARKKLLSLHRPDFEKRWLKSQNWTLLVVPRVG